MTGSTNGDVAAKLREMADTLEQQGEDGYRIRAYRRAARTVEGMAEPIDKIAREEGIDGLDRLPGIGKGIASAILEMVTTGRWSGLDRLTGALEPEQLFMALPGVGPELAAKIHDTLQVETLEDLEVAAHDGRLEEVPGIGKRRAEAIRLALGSRLGRRRLRSAVHSPVPPVEMLLATDRDYRAKAEHGTLRRIAPKRFNPSGEAWLPVMHARHGDWQLTALFSNTKQAHDLGRTHDWVVIYFHSGNEPENQCTVVTETHGALAGRRVVRGREGECARHYAEHGG